MYLFRAYARVLDLGNQGFAQVRIRTILVIGQLGDERTNFADALATLFSDQSTLRQLGERPVWHRHDRLLPLALTWRDRAAMHTHMRVCNLSRASVSPLPPTLLRKGQISRSAWSGSRTRRATRARCMSRSLRRLD